MDQTVSSYLLLTAVSAIGLGISWFKSRWPAPYPWIWTILLAVSLMGTAVGLVNLGRLLH